MWLKWNWAWKQMNWACGVYFKGVGLLGELVAYHNFAYFKWFYQKNNVLSPSLLRFHVPVYPEIVDSITVFPWFGLRHGTYNVGATECKDRDTY